MANENEDIKKEKTENDGGGDNTEEHKHHTWVGDLIEKIEEKIDNIDADFPLSGGEEPHHTHHKTAEEIEEEAKKEAHRKTQLDHDLNVDFPLSGGEE